MSSFDQVGVVGAGSWGTALALVLHSNGLPVTLWGHEPEQIAAMQASRENSYLPGVPLPETLRFTTDLGEVSDAPLLPVQCAASEVATITASHPFAASQKKVISPHFLPSTRQTFVAPMLPLPCCRMSMPRDLETMSPNGIEPRR